MKTSTRCKLANAASLMLLAAGPVQAEVTAFFSADAKCTPATSVRFELGKPLNLSVCMTSTREAVCGYSLRLESATPEQSGRFRIKARVLGKNYNDPTAGSLPAGLVVSNPASGPDLGATRDNPLAAAPNQLLATLTLVPLADMKQDAYVLRLAANSVAGVSGAVSCADATDAPLNAAVTLQVAARNAKK